MAEAAARGLECVPLTRAQIDLSRPDAELRRELRARLWAARLCAEALGGRAALELDGSRLADADVALDLAGNRLLAKGRYGRPGDGLALNLDAPQLAALGHGLGGRLRLGGVLRGSPAQPNGEFELAAEKLRFGSLLLDALNGHGRVAEGRQGTVSLKLDLEGLHSGGDEALVRRASLLIDGNRAANTTRLAVAGRGTTTLAMNLAGTLSDGLRWDGQLAGLEVGGDYSVRLLAPAAHASGSSMPWEEPLQRIAADIRPAVQGVVTSARRVARTAGLWIAHEAELHVYEEGLSDIVVGYTVRAVVDEATRKKHRERNGTAYYRHPKAGQLGYDSMPRPPRESPKDGGGWSFNCRCFLDPILSPDL